MNPVLVKDALGLLRLKRVAAVHVAFVAALGLLVLATWPQQGLVALADRGRDDLLLGLILGQLVLLVLFVPGVAAVALTAEREGGTLEMLYASRLSPASIALGKIGSALGYPLLLLVAGLPFAALLAWRGDVRVETLGAAYLVLGLAAAFLASVSLAVSALCDASGTALVAAYLAVLTVCGGVMVPALLMLQTQAPPVSDALHVLRSLSPVAAELSILRPGLAGLGDGARGFTPAWQIFVGFAGVVTVASLALVAWTLRKPPGRAEAPAGAVAVGDRRSVGRRVMFLIDDAKPARPFGDLSPVAAKESRTNKLRSGRWMVRIFYGSVGLSMALALMALLGGGPEYPDLLGYAAAVIVALQFAVVALLCPSLTAPAISGEVEGDTFEMLRMTPLGAGRIFWGKLIPAVVPALLPVVALLPAYGVLCFIDAAYVPAVARLVPTAALATALCCGVGLACSAFAGATARATVAAYLIVAAVFLVPLAAYALTGPTLAERVGRWPAMVSPLVMGLAVLPNGSSVVSSLYGWHLAVACAMLVAALVLARARIGAMLRRG